ncbi:hypothetical protein PFISCL1PPCAC_24885 [Pristionchus fissidentatus]|uniref:UBX domain-containing protein n=1 Tax=Pristionchus fissidentatus TaxID=1538716 RepID=A0AAV5WQB6_9BILA|nr:hypothetical protein PFISCL1PPCAC_24885 [Pristionchus fissidentatus]
MAETAERQQVLTNFKDVCAVDDAKAREFLSHCDYNLERAVQLFFQTGGVLDNTNEGFENERNWENELRRRVVVDGRQGEEASNSSSSSDLSAASNQRPNRVAAVRQMSWVEWFMAIAALPINIFISTLHDVIEGIWGLFGGGRQQEVTDARGDVARFIAKYEEHYAHAVQYRIQFSQEPFMEACQRAKRELRALLVFLHDENSHESSTFLRDALSSIAVGNLITSSNLHVWGISTATPEGARVARQLRARSYPTACLMMARDGRMITTLRLNAMPADRLVNNLAVGINMVDMHLQQLRTAQLRREEDSRIRAEQEEEYREALAADRAKKEQRERKEREAREKEEALKRAEEEREECKRILVEKKEELKSLVSSEVEGEAVRVQIRFPSGDKIERKFGLDETVESLFNAALIADFCPPLFSLHTNYPRRSLPYVPSWYAEWRTRAFPSESLPEVPVDVCARTFREENLLQSLVVMVQDEAS